MQLISEFDFKPSRCCLNLLKPCTLYNCLRFSSPWIVEQNSSNITATTLMVIYSDQFCYLELGFQWSELFLSGHYILHSFSDLHFCQLLFFLQSHSKLICIFFLGAGHNIWLLFGQASEIRYIGSKRHTSTSWLVLLDQPSMACFVICFVSDLMLNPKFFYVFVQIETGI